MRKVNIPAALPCPYCGSLDGFVEMMNICVARYWCNECAALGPPVEDGDYVGAGDRRAERDAIKVWNRRRAPRRTKSKG